MGGGQIYIFHSFLASWLFLGRDPLFTDREERWRDLWWDVNDDEMMVRLDEHFIYDCSHCSLFKRADEEEW